MGLRCRYALLYSVVFLLGQFAFAGITVKAFADDIVQISTTILPSAQVGLSYSAPVVAGDGAAPFQWYVSSGSLPSGLSLDSQTGAISGTPDASGVTSFTAGITDAEGFSASVNLSLVVNSATTSVSSPAYGAAVGSDGLANTTIGPDQNKISFRFRAKHSGVLQQSTVYLMPDHDGYASGTGGTIQVTLCTDDGTDAHNPSDTVLATYMMTNVDSLPSPSRYFYVLQFPAPPTLSAGQVYHLVFQNVDSDPENNFLSVNALYEENWQSPTSPAASDPDAAVLLSEGGGEWYPRTAYTPIYELDFQDGSSEGIGYMEAWVGDQNDISGTSMVRETFTVSGSQINVSSAAIRLSRIAGDDPLTIRLENADGSLIDEGSVEASAIPMSSSSSPINAWAVYPFSTSHTLVPGQTYNLVFQTASTSNYQAFPVQKGNYYGFQPTTYFQDGYAQVNSGDSWVGWSQWGSSNRTDGDLQFYLSVTP